MYAKDVGKDWEGGLGDEIEYWTGPGDRMVRMVNEVDTKVTPIWSVFAYIPGHIKVCKHLFDDLVKMWYDVMEWLILIT